MLEAKLKKLKGCPLWWPCGKEAEDANVIWKAIRMAVEQRQVLDHAIGLCGSHRVALDVGAFVGMYAERMSEHFDHVWAFEPVRLIYEALERNSPLNVMPVNLAVSDRSGYLDFTILTSSEEHVMYGNVCSGEGIKTRCVALDNVIPGDLPVDLVKVDCDGHDLQALVGMRKILQKNRPVVVVEEKDLGDSTQQTPSEFLTIMGYRLDSIFNINKVFACR